VRHARFASEGLFVPTSHLDLPGGRRKAVTLVRRKRRRLIIGLALLGLAITAAIYASIPFTPYSEPPSGTTIALGFVSIILCPPGLLTVPLFDIDAYTPGGAVLWLLIGLINAGLYAVIGALVGSFLWKSGDPSAPPGN
jgi:hypothetical protein